MKTKLYFHYEPNDGNAVTIPVMVDEDTMLETSLLQFIHIIEPSNPFFHAIFPRHCILKLENEKILSLSSKKTLLDLIGEETDLFLTIDYKLLSAEEKTKSVYPPPPPPITAGKGSSAAGNRSTSSPSTVKVSTTISENFEQSISLLKEFMTKRLYKRAKLLTEKIMISMDFATLSSSSMTVPYQLHFVYVYQCIMEIHYHAKRFNETIKCGIQLINLLQKDSNGNNNNTNNNSNNVNNNVSHAINKSQIRKLLANYKQFQYYEFLYIFAKSYFELKKYEKCLEIMAISIDQYQQTILNITLATAAAALSSSSSSTAPTASPSSGPGTAKSIPATNNKVLPTVPPTSTGGTQQSLSSSKISKLKHHKQKIHFYLNMISLQAESTYLLGEHLQAANILNTVMDIPLGDSNLLILKTYILFTFQYFKYTETMSAVLKTIAIIGTDSKKLSTLSSTSFSNNTLPAGLSHATTTTTLATVNTSHVIGNNGHQYTNSPVVTSAGSSSSPSVSLSTSKDSKDTTAAATATTSSASAADEKATSKARQGQKTLTEHKKQRDENYINQTDSDDDELDANQQMYDYEYPSQIKAIKQLIIKFLLTKEGFEQLMKRLPPNSRGTAEIYAYLATVAKEFSATELSIKLYEIALQIQSNSINYTLNLIHIYELSYDYMICLEFIQIFCAKNLNLSIGKDRLVSTNSSNSMNSSNPQVLLPLLPNRYILCCADVINIIKQNSLFQSTYRNVEVLSPVAKGRNSGEKSSVVGGPATTMAMAVASDEKYLYYKVNWNLSDNATLGQGNSKNEINQAGYASVERYIFQKDEKNETDPSLLSLSVSLNSNRTNSNNKTSLADVKIPKISFLPDDRNTTAVTTSSTSLSIVQYSDRELDLIALISTMVKIYYLQGNLFMIPLFIERLEIIRQCSLHPLHQTYIRNELAYYQDIVQILAARSQLGFYGLSYIANAILEKEEANPEATTARPASKTAGGEGGAGEDERSVPLAILMEYAMTNLWHPSYHPVINQARENIIYICGDSHCLSLGWNIIQRSSSSTEDGKYHLLVPKLVTGVKQWHLRNESSFYPKQNYYNAMNESIPKLSEVIILIGEIDCREGFLVALERDYYDSIEDAMNTTIKGYLHNLQTIRDNRQLKIYVHPIPPVLNETRKIVMLFNALYKQRIEELKDPNIVWLEFLYDLVDRVPSSASSSSSSNNKIDNDNGSLKTVNEILSEEYQLKDIYHHDGTHLHPRYAGLVEKAINQLSFR